jgi:hypothetical protein
MPSTVYCDSMPHHCVLCNAQCACPNTGAEAQHCGVHSVDSVALCHGTVLGTARHGTALCTVLWNCTVHCATALQCAQEGHRMPAREVGGGRQHVLIQVPRHSTVHCALCTVPQHCTVPRNCSLCTVSRHCTVHCATELFTVHCATALHCALCHGTAQEDHRMPAREVGGGRQHVLIQVPRHSTVHCALCTVPRLRCAARHCTATVARHCTVHCATALCTVHCAGVKARGRLVVYDVCRESKSGQYLCICVFVYYICFMDLLLNN